MPCKSQLNADFCRAFWFMRRKMTFVLAIMRNFAIMNIETFRNYCLSLPMATEDMAFGPGILLFRVCDKIFGCIGLERGSGAIMKCDPEYAAELREHYPEITTAPAWNKKYWNNVSFTGRLTDDLIISLIRHSYAIVVKKLPARVRRQYPAICIPDPRAEEY